jgi:hypothetical protein
MQSLVEKLGGQTIVDRGPGHSLMGSSSAAAAAGPAGPPAAAAAGSGPPRRNPWADPNVRASARLELTCAHGRRARAVGAPGHAQGLGGGSCRCQPRPGRCRPCSEASPGSRGQARPCRRPGETRVSLRCQAAACRGPSSCPCHAHARSRCTGRISSSLKTPVCLQARGCCKAAVCLQARVSGSFVSRGRRLTTRTLQNESAAQPSKARLGLHGLPAKCVSR